MNYVLLSFVLYHWKGKNLISKIGVEIANSYVANKNEPYWKKKTQQKYIRKTSYYTVCIRWQKQIDRLCVCNDMRIIYNHIDIRRSCFEVKCFFDWCNIFCGDGQYTNDFNVTVKLQKYTVDRSLFACPQNWRRSWMSVVVANIFFLLY